MSEPPPPVRVLRFGVFEADLRTGELRRKGRKVRLQEKPFQILAAFLELPGQEITRAELQRRLWPAGTFVDLESGLNTAMLRLRTALGDSAQSPRFIETRARHGYRFIAAVEVAGSASPRPAARAISLAVLPFSNLSGDPSQEYFAEGMTDLLTTGLAKIGGLRVVSRTSATQFRGARAPLAEITRQLGVDVVIEGSVMRSPRRVRVTVQLIDAREDRHLWAESYDRARADVVLLQEELAETITRRVAGTLQVRSLAMAEKPAT